MTENANTRKPVEVGLNKYGQRLDEYNEFGQSLEAEVWYFGGEYEAPGAPAPVLERVIPPAHVTTGSSKPAGVGLNKYGQRLDEYNEFGQSLEAEVWYFGGNYEAPAAPAPARKRMIRPALTKKQTAAKKGTSLTAAHRRAA